MSGQNLKMWYQPIEFPDGTKKRAEDLDKDSFGKKEWYKVIKPNLPKGESLLDIGCNAGIHFYLADYKKLYGIERHPEYFEQCLEVLEKFDIQAEVILGDALDVEIPEVDITLMSKSLHWVGYSDEEEFIEDYENVVDEFLERLSRKTKHLLIIGAEEMAVDRIGGSLEKTLPHLEKYFKIIKTEKVQLDRPLNIILCKTL